MITIVGLLLLGLALIIVEILVVPGTTLVGILGAILMAAGIYFAYTEYGSTYGHYTLVTSAVVSTGTLYAAFKSGAWKRFMNKNKLKGKAKLVDETKVNVGDKGVTVSELRPIGKAMINDFRLEVHSKGEYIETGKEIEVLKVVQNKVVVGLLTKQ
ncbi:MAG: hypothetical protein COC01_03825 [Bacteroidetes bacterium]|nr:hypothetical protein [Bacteroidia bacterium]PCH68400.1 MAG: hypothetical protein COC01_03825 [Bacteroidota bacterium]